MKKYEKPTLIKEELDIIDVIAASNTVGKTYEADEVIPFGNLGL